MFLCVLLMLTLFAGASSLTCEECQFIEFENKYVNDIDVSTCPEDFHVEPNYREEECNKTVQYCMKWMETGIHYLYGDYRIIGRGCGDHCSREGVMEMDFSNVTAGYEYFTGNKATVYCCKGDGCNGALSTMPGLCLSITAALMVITNN